jgi:RNA polymerase sigma-70 factor (ECF subfamily)
MGYLDHPKLDQEFVRALQAKDANAWTDFVDEFGAKLYNYLRYQLPTEENVNDVWQEILVATTQSIADFAGDVSLSTFVYSIAYRKVADFWRRQRVPVVVSEFVLQDDGPFSELMAGLPEQVQHALVLRYYLGLTITEIAEILGRSVKATESLLSRARQMFRSATGPELARDATTTFEQLPKPPSPKDLFGAAYPLLLLQKQICQQNGFHVEALIFDRAQRKMEQIAAASQVDFLELLHYVRRLHTPEMKTQFLSAIYEGVYKYDNSSQY